jgi:hypothetical protein
MSSIWIDGLQLYSSVEGRSTGGVLTSPGSGPDSVAFGLADLDALDFIRTAEKGCAGPDEVPRRPVRRLQPRSAGAAA